MIQLTRLNKHKIGVNSDLIKFIENAPDTMITLLSGEKILVLETFEEILERIVAFRQHVLSGLDLTDYVANSTGVETSRLPGIQRATARQPDVLENWETENGPEKPGDPE